MADDSAKLHVEAHGSGVPVLLFHGSGGDTTSWAQQLPLADTYRLMLVDRRGYGESPPRSFAYDLAKESDELAALVTAPLHLVGQSYGGVRALLVASKKPSLIRSLTLSEPPAFSVARGHPDVEWLIAQLTPLYDQARDLTLEEYDAGFDATVGFAHDPTPATGRRLRNLDTARMEQAPWLAAIDLDVLATASFPKLVISGGWGGDTDSASHRSGRAFTAVCDALEERLRAGRAVIRGAGHSIPRTGQPFNAQLRAFCASTPSE